MSTVQYDAIVVGAGVAGSSTAILLARAGWSVALIEKQRFPRRKVCGECIAATNLPLLDSLGIGPQFARLAGPEIRRFGLMRGERTVLTDMPARGVGIDGSHRWGRALGRETLDTLLMEAARAGGVTVLQPCAVETIGGKPGRWTCEARMLESGEQVRLCSTVLVDAHGSWESLRAQRPAVRETQRAGDLIAFKANYSGARLADGVLPVLAFNGGYGGMVMGDGGIVTLACCVRRDRLEQLRAASPGTAAGVVVEDYLRQSCTGVGTALDGAVREGAWLASGPLRPGIRRPVAGQPFRVGNAAGEIHPIIGEGMSIGLQSSFLLCSLLVPHGPGLSNAGASMHDALNRRYGMLWRRRFGVRMCLASLFAHVAMRRVPGAGLVMLAARVPAMLRWGARLAGKTRIDVPSM